MNTLEPIVLISIFLLGMFCGFLMLWLIVRGRNHGLRAAEDAMRDTFKALASDALLGNLQLQQNKLDDAFKPLGETVSQLRVHLQHLELKRENAYTGLSEKLKHLELSHHNLMKMTSMLNQSLRSSGVRGRWGEITLKRIVEMAGMVEHVDFVEQKAGNEGKRPDLLVRLPNGAMLPVDAKAPMNSYLDAVQCDDQQVREAKLKEHSQALRNQVRLLSSKSYWEQFESSPDFVVMFIPGEPFLGGAVQVEPQLIEHAVEQKVLIATPVTLIALLKSVAYGWQQQTIMEGVREISENSRELGSRMQVFLGHFSELGGVLGKLIEKYNGVIGSYERRVRPALERLQQSSGQDPTNPEARTIESLPKEL